MALVDFDRQTLVREFSYSMNGVQTGTLFLLDGPSYDKLVSWRSARTGLRTGWHGSWAAPVGGDPDMALTLYFDFEGRPASKWATVQSMTMQMLVPRQWMVGIDYMNRGIVMRQISTWTFDVNTAGHVVRTL